MVSLLASSNEHSVLTGDVFLLLFVLFRRGPDVTVLELCDALNCL